MNHRVCIVEAGRKIVKQAFKPRVAVWLGNGDHPALAGVAGGRQHRLDLDGMVAVIVEHLDPVPASGMA
jgi:hypothetical protein